MPRARTVLFLHGSAGGYGADRQLELLATRLDPARYRPLVVLPDRGGLATRLDEAGVEVVVSRLAVLQRQLRRGRGAVAAARLTARNVRELGELARRRRVSIVHSNYSLILCGQRVAERAGAAHFLHVREIYADPLWPLLRRRMLRADAVACVSDAVAARFPDSERVFVLRDGLVREPPRVRRAEARRELGLDPESFVVATLGRVSDWKGQHVLVRALADPALADVEAVALVAGDAAPRQAHFETELAELAASLNLDGRVRLLGFHDDVDVLLAAADAVAVPSVYPDSLPNSAIEAAAAGLPVVATDTGGQREIVQDGVSGTIVPAGDAHALALALRDLAADPLRAARLGRAGADDVRARFAADDVLAALQDRYDGVLAARTTGPAAWLLPVKALATSHPAAPELRTARFATWLEELGYRPVVLERRGLRSAPALVVRACRERPALVLAGAAVHAPALAAIRSLRRGRTRTIADVIGLHSLELDAASPRLRGRETVRRVWMALERVLVRSAHVVVAVNDRHAEIVRRRYRSTGVVTLRDTADVASVEPAGRTSTGVPEDVVAVGFAGSLVYGRLDELLDAWDSVPAWLVVVGDGPDLERYRSRAPENVVFLGGLPHAEALAVLRACDVGYSDCWSEAGFPAKLFEYLALGLPIVTAATPQAREVLRDDREALLYGSTAELVQHLRRLAAEPELRTRLGAAARRTHLAHHSPDRRRQEFEAVVAGANERLTFRRMEPGDVRRLWGVRSRWHGREWLERQQRGDGYLLVVERDGNPVGRVGIDFSKRVAPGIAYLSSGWVKGRLRSTGVGTALSAQLDVVARELGFDTLRIDVNKANDRARDLYLRLGYELRGEEIVRWSFPRLGRTVEVVEDCWTLLKPLYAAAESTMSAATSSSVLNEPSARSSASSSA